MALAKEMALSQLGPMRGLAHRVPFLERFPSIIGLGDGLLRREQIMALLHQEDLALLPESQQRSTWEVILDVAKLLPQPFWLGIHPHIAKKIRYHLSNPEAAFWNQPLQKSPKQFEKAALIPTEPNLDWSQAQSQADFVSQFLPQQTTRVFFFTNGQNSLWKSIPLAGIFADNPHQMSLPSRLKNLVGGFNMLLLTGTESVTMPNEWRDHSRFSTLEMMNLHQVGHCLVVPTCWEYLDRSYGLLTPNQLLELTRARVLAQARWFAHYGFDSFLPEDLFLPHESELAIPQASQPYQPDSTSYLYEIKIVERALIFTAAKRCPPQTSLPSEMYWFRGLHLDQICEELQVSQEKVIGALCVLHDFWIDHHHEFPSDQVFNSVFQSTDIGTHPAEEICVDVLARAVIGDLPPEMQYWQPWLTEIEKAWQRHDPSFQLHKPQPSRAKLAGARNSPPR